MSEAIYRETDDAGEPDGLELSALIASRVCHDLINPIGAISSGLEVLEDPSMDSAMREAAANLINAGATKALALLTYARLAYGQAGGFGAEIKLEDARKALEGVFATAKSTLDWRLLGAIGAKENVKALMVLAWAAADCVPRGGEVVIDGEIDDFTVTASGPKLVMQEGLARALAGDAADIMPKFAPILVVAKLARDAGGALTAEKSDEKIVMSARFRKG